MGAVMDLDRSNIDKIAQNPEDRLLLAKLWDKITAGIRKNIPANTGFLSPREQEMAQFLFGDAEGLTFFGGHPDAERKMLIFLPEYLEESQLMTEDSPVACIRAKFYAQDCLSHRDFLGALMGAGISRETVGDICVSEGSCDFFATAEIAPYILQNLSSAGRTKLHLSQVCLEDAALPEPEFSVIRDTVASVRLDSIISTGFRISRSLAGEYIAAGKVAIDGLPCEKPDRLISQGTKLSLRGMGKIRLETIGNQTKKGRTTVVIHRYM